MFGNYDTLGGDSSGASASFAATRAPESEERASADQSPVIGSESSGQQPDISSAKDQVSAPSNSQSTSSDDANTSSSETPCCGSACHELTNRQLRPRAKN